MMRWQEWKPYYENIVHSLPIDSDKDYEAADQYYKIITTYSDSHTKIIRSLDLSQTIFKPKIFVFGAGPSLSTDIENFQKSYLDTQASTIVAVDGSTKALLEFDIQPDIVISDYDGDMQAILRAAKSRALLVMHAHGDNQGLVKDWFPKIQSTAYWIPTVQTEPIPPYIYNFGGFTDGDRAVAFVLNFIPSTTPVILLGFTFGRIVGKYSKPFYPTNHLASTFKLKKLAFAKQFLSDLAQKFYPNHQIWNYSAEQEPIQGLKTGQFV